MTFLDLEKSLDDLGDSVTPFLANKTAQQEIEFAIDPSKGLTKKRYAWYSNNSLFDSSFVSNIAGGLELSTGSSSGDTARIRSSVPGQYQSQTLAVPGIGFNVEPNVIEVDSDNLVSTDSGLVAIGAGWHDNSAGGWDVNGSSGTIRSFLGLKIDTAGSEVVLISEGQHRGGSPVSQENWNIDTLDGSSDEDNPSGMEFRPDNGYIINTPYTWYNQGALVIGFIDKTRNRFIPIHRFEVDGIPSIDRPNLPTTVILDNDGNAETIITKVGGMQYSRYGTGEVTDVRVTPISRQTTGNYISNTVAVDSNDSIDPRAEPGKPLVSVQKQDSLDDTVGVVETVSLDSDNDVYVFVWDEYEPSAALTGENFRQPTGIDTVETKYNADTSATDYTPQTALLRGWKKIKGGKKDSEISTDRTDDRIPIDATRIYTVVNAGTDTDADPFKIDIQESF